MWTRWVAKDSSDGCKEEWAGHRFDIVDEEGFDAKGWVDVSIRAVEALKRRGFGQRAHVEID